MRFTKLVTVVTFLLLSLLTAPAQAGWFGLSVTPAPPSDPNRPYNLICFSKKGLTTILSRVVNSQQFLRNDLGQTVSRKKMVNQGCDFVKIPANSTARRAGFYQSKEGFIFPIFGVTYSTTGQNMYAADGIFLTKHWRLHKIRKSRYGLFGTKIAPKNCEVLDGLVDLSKDGIPPDYVYLPRECRTYIIR
jgi:hypothetical protein